MAYFCIMILLVSSLISNSFYNRNLSNKITEEKECVETKTEIRVIVSHDRKSFDSRIEKVKNIIDRLNLKHPDIVLAQCILESGRFESGLTKTNNNLLGMKHPAQRPTLSKGKKNGFAHFDSWEDCIVDYAIWQSIYTRKLSRDEYLDYLSTIYDCNKNYKSIVIDILNGLDKTK